MGHRHAKGPVGLASLGVFGRSSGLYDRARDPYFKLRNLGTFHNLRRPIAIMMVVAVACHCRNHNAWR
eukprot:13429898-Alexandrium_andersonii.AAC.1